MNITRRDAVLTGLAMAAASGLPSRAGAAGKPLRVGSLKFGSLSWLIETVRAEGLADKAGLKWEIVDTASTGAARIGLLSGDLDVVVSDWPWAMRQRSLGDPLKFSPYSSALGGVMVPEASPLKTLADLKGQRLGVAGSSIDKSWILLRAYAQKAAGFDIATQTTAVFGAAPLITEQLRQGRVEAALNFWTFSARLKGSGYRELVSMAEAMAGLGIAPPPPLVGYIWSEKQLAGREAELAKLLAVLAEGNQILATRDEAWPRLKDVMRSPDEGEFKALRDYYRSGITGPWTAELTASSGQLMKLLIDLGDPELVGADTKFDGALFHGA
ncbi:MAG: transporter substrate-binding domain-containing protein [Hyphomicrobiaceae bacterium]|nr:transporter substrate-binding domain-containing protein [Hyphomicrobiaceae bacterium]